LGKTDGKEKRIMKTARTIVLVATLSTLVWAGAVEAQENKQEPGRSWCSPAGVWIGQNHTYELEYVITIEKMGAGCFSIVADGVELVAPWESSTRWRGMLRRTGRHTFSMTQVALAGPSQFLGMTDGVPDIAAIRGVLTQVDCDHFEVEFEPTELYAWGQKPFVDSPVATLPPSIASYERVPMDCKDSVD
jgi:hypothetical protein